MPHVLHFVAMCFNATLDASRGDFHANRHRVLIINHDVEANTPSSLPLLLADVKQLEKGTRHADLTLRSAVLHSPARFRYPSICYRSLYLIGAHLPTSITTSTVAHVFAPLHSHHGLRSEFRVEGGEGAK